MTAKQLANTKMAKRMGTTRAQLDRLLEPDDPFDDGSSGGDALGGVLTHLLLHRARDPALGAQLAECSRS